LAGDPCAGSPSSTGRCGEVNGDFCPIYLAPLHVRAIKVSDGEEQQFVYVAKISDKINVLGLSPETTPNTIVSACVWEALIADPVERRICHWKSNQVIRIKERIQELGLPIKEAAERMEISRVQMESLFRGRINEFTPEEMASMFFKLDIQVSGR